MQLARASRGGVLYSKECNRGGDADTVLLRDHGGTVDPEAQDMSVC
jgi:hypothetical protein